MSPLNFFFLSFPAALSAAGFLDQSIKEKKTQKKSELRYASYQQDGC
jgi:hypothetical protein